MGTEWTLLVLAVVAACVTTGANKDHSWKAQGESSLNVLDLDLQTLLKKSVDLASLEFQTDNGESSIPLSLEDINSMKDQLIDSLKQLKSIDHKKSKTSRRKSRESTAYQTTPTYSKNYVTTSRLDGDQHSTTTPVSTVGAHPIRVGSIRGIPGVNFPNYTEIPLTNFSCWEKSYEPGFYADLDTGCQVFHVCWPDRRESFLCPLGTTFNQALLTCDYWYSSNCSLSPYYYDVNEESGKAWSENRDAIRRGVGSHSYGKGHQTSGSGDTAHGEGSNHPRNQTEIPMTTYTEASATPKTPKVSATPEALTSYISQFLPIKARVVVYPETSGQRPKIIATTSIGSEKQPIPRQVTPKDQVSTELPTEETSNRPPTTPTPTRRPSKCRRKPSPDSDYPHPTEVPTVTSSMSPNNPIQTPKPSTCLCSSYELTDEEKEKQKSEEKGAVIQRLLKRIKISFLVALKEIEEIENCYDGTPRPPQSTPKPPQVTPRPPQSTPKPPQVTPRPPQNTPRPSQNTPRPQAEDKRDGKKPLTRLNPRFIIKPVKINRTILPKGPKKVKASKSGKKTGYISLKTKKALIKSYLDLLKGKSG